MLYGFASADERDLFRQLISVSGIGAASAITLGHTGTARFGSGDHLWQHSIANSSPGVGGS